MSCRLPFGRKSVSHSPPRSPRWMRRSAMLMSVVFPVTSLLSLPSQAWAQTVHSPAFAAPKPVLAPVVHDDPAWHTIDYHAQEHAAPLSPAQAAKAAVHAPRLTLLDEVGRLASPVDDDKVAGWKRALHQTKKLTPSKAARLHVLVGEVALARDENPEQALWHFAQARSLSHPKEAVYGLASYDSAVARFYEGAYGAAKDAFKQVLTAKPGLHGFDWATCTLFMRHASACAGYHEERAKLGIPEPPQLDPLCGASAVAQALKAAGKPYDKQTLLRNMRVTGRGSNMQDVVNGAQKLGFAARVVHVKDAGLIALPKPLVAYVEHDHFVSVTNADKKGVTYLCADCGPWPGGKVSLTWQQWHKLEATAYAVLSKPGSDIDAALSAMLTPGNKEAQGVQVASLSGKLADGVRGRLNWMRLLRKQITQPEGSIPTYCGYGPGSQHCPDPVNCPSDCGGSNGDGPSMGDPVNLATGEEEYRPTTDLTVYNPVGPSISWGRIYNSLRGIDIATQMDDFGQGWSHPYNVTMYDQTVTRQAGSYAPGDTITIPATGNDAPANPAHWDVVFGGSVIATDQTPQGWQVTAGGSNITVTIPATASLGNYEVRSSGNVPMQLSRLLPRRFAAACRQAPQANGGGSAFFTLSQPVYVPHTGTRYFVEPNGARVSITANAVPSAAQPSVSCVVQAGVSMLAEWDYDANNSLGHYVITRADRTRLITTPAAKFRTWADDALLPPNAIGAVYELGQMVDRNGNAITFNYGASDAGGFPLLSSIADKNGAALLTFNRTNSGTGNLTSVADRYGRSVYYRVSTHQNTGVVSYRPQSQQELDHVSQVVASGAASPPDRFVYGYQNVGNGDNGETIPFLHTITVPSATGTGTQTATINYLANYCTVLSLVDANGNSRNYSQPDASHTKVTIKDPQGNVAASYTAGYDMNMSMTTFTDGTNTHSRLTGSYADPNDPYKQSTVTDSSNHTTNYTWDNFGNLITLTTARGTQIVNSWDYNAFALGRQMSSQTGAKTPVTYTYSEPSGLLQSIAQPAPGHAGDNVTATTSFTYDALGNELTATMPGNNAAATITATNNYTVDRGYTQSAAKRQPLAVTNALGKSMHRRYDAQGNLTVIQDALGNETDVAYNTANQPTQIALPATGQTGSGRALVVNVYLFPGGPQTGILHYDESGNLLRQVSYSLGKEGEMLANSGNIENSSYSYDAAYRRRSVKDGNNNTTTYAYNTTGYLSGVSYPNHNGNADTVQFTAYDANGQLATRIDGNGVETDYVRTDPERQLTDIKYPATPANNIHFTYDSYGRRATMSDSTGSSTYAYDDTDAPVSITTAYTGLPALTVTYSYNPDGSRQSLTAPSGTTSYTYDAARRMTGLSGPSDSVSWTYLDNDWLWTQTDNAATTTFTYNALGMLKRLTNTGGANYGNGAVLSDYNNLSYDGVTNCTSFTSSLPSSPAFSGTTGFAYDSQNQLMQEQSNRNGGYTHTFAYDAAQNPTTFKGVANTYNADNQNTAYTYDGNGNPVVYRGASLSYDAENRMTTCGTVLTAGYNGDGLRAWKQTTAGRTYFLYDGETPIVELSASGIVTAANTVGANGLLSRKTATATTYYTFDTQGNVAQRLSGGGVVSCLFDAHGVGLSSNGSNDPFGYKAQYGYYTDTETGLLLLTHRYYDPTSGRFLTRDPIGFQGGTNVYAYCNNRPTRLMDGRGTMPWWVYVACAPCISCLVDLMLVCMDRSDGESWGQCAYGVIQNLPLWAKILCGGICAACIVAIAVHCSGDGDSSLQAGQQSSAPSGGSVKPCTKRYYCELTGMVTCQGKIISCQWYCTDPDDPAGNFNKVTSPVFWEGRMQCRLDDEF